MSRTRLFVLGSLAALAILTHSHDVEAVTVVDEIAQFDTLTQAIDLQLDQAQAHADVLASVPNAIDSETVSLLASLVDPNCFEAETPDTRCLPGRSASPVKHLPSDDGLPARPSLRHLHRTTRQPVIVRAAALRSDPQLYGYFQSEEGRRYVGRLRHVEHLRSLGSDFV